MKHFELKSLDIHYLPRSLKKKKKNKSCKQHPETRKMKKEYKRDKKENTFKGSLKEYAKLNNYDDWFVRKQVG